MTTDPTKVPARPWDAAWPAEVPRSLSYPAQPAWWILERNLDRHADRLAIQVVDHRSGLAGVSLTYGQLISVSWPLRSSYRPMEPMQ